MAYKLKYICFSHKNKKLQCSRPVKLIVQTPGKITEHLSYLPQFCNILLLPWLSWFLIHLPYYISSFRLGGAWYAIDPVQWPRSIEPRILLPTVGACRQSYLRYCCAPTSPIGTLRILRELMHQRINLTAEISVPVEQAG